MGSHSSRYMKSDEWLTPPDIIRDLGPFDLDPCSPALERRPWPTAKEHYHENGLLLPWHGFVWCNPPYSGQEQGWFNKMVMHGNGLVLIFARTETAIWHEYLWKNADAFFFFRGRLYFHHAVTGAQANDNAGAPSVLVAFGEEAVRRLRNYRGRKGHFIINKSG